MNRRKAIKTILAMGTASMLPAAAVVQEPEHCIINGEDLGIWVHKTEWHLMSPNAGFLGGYEAARYDG